MLFSGGTACGLTDAELLERFATREGKENAWTPGATALGTTEAARLERVEQTVADILKRLERLESHASPRMTPAAPQWAEAARAAAGDLTGRSSALCGPQGALRWIDALARLEGEFREGLATIVEF